MDLALKVVTLHKIKDSFVSKNLEREPTIMEKLNHPSTVSLQGRLCQQLLLMSGRRLRPMEAISATRLEARVSGASSCLRRKAGGCSTVVSLSLATMAMKTIVTTKEAFELNYKREKQCLLRWPSVLFHPRPIFILAALQLWPSMQQVFLKFSHNDGDARLQQ